MRCGGTKSTGSHRRPDRRIAAEQAPPRAVRCVEPPTSSRGQAIADSSIPSSSRGDETRARAKSLLIYRPVLTRLAVQRARTAENSKCRKCFLAMSKLLTKGRPVRGGRCDVRNSARDRLDNASAPKSSTPARAMAAVLHQRTLALLRARGEAGVSSGHRHRFVNDASKRRWSSRRKAAGGSLGQSVGVGATFKPIPTTFVMRPRSARPRASARVPSRRVRQVGHEHAARARDHLCGDPQTLQ